MTETPPPSWRDVANGRFEVDPKPLPSYDEPPAGAPEATAAAPVPSAPAPAESHGGAGRTVAAVLVTALLAGGGGYAVGALDPFGLHEDEESSESDTDLAAREAALTAETQELAKAQRKLRKRERKVTKRTKALDTRAATLQAAEREVEQAAEELAAQADLSDTVTDDGVFEVGADVASGTWTSSGGSDSCTWVVRTAETGGDVLVQESAAGGSTATVTLDDGVFFETSACGEWSLTP